MALIAGILIIVIGLIICFRGICIASVFKALFGAIQGIVYAFMVQLILRQLNIVTGSWLYLLFVCIAAILAYLAAKREELYQKIQGFINSILIGGVIAGVVYGYVKLSLYQNYLMNGGSDNSTMVAGLLAAGIVIVFTVVGVKWYKAFRRIGPFVIVLALAAFLLRAYMQLWAAILLALVIDAIAMYFISVYEKYIEFIKIAAIGACISVAGFFVVIGLAYMIPTSLSALGSSVRMTLMPITVLTIWGAISQRKYYDAHLDENGLFHVEIKTWFGKSKELVDKASSNAADKAQDISKRISRSINSVKRALARNKEKFKKVAIGVLILAVVGSIGYGGIRIIKGIMSSAKKGTQVRQASSFADIQVNSLNAAYADAEFSLEGVIPLEGSSNGDLPGYTIAFSGTISGSLYVTGWYNDHVWYTDKVSVRVNHRNYSNANAVAELFGAVMHVFYEVDTDVASNEIRQVMSDNSDGMQRELLFGSANNTYIRIWGSYDDQWMAECGEKF